MKIQAILNAFLAFHIFTPVKLINNSLALCSLRNFDFSLLNTEHFDKNIILPFLVFKTFGFLLSVFFLHSKQ